MNIKYKTDCFPKMFPGREQSFDGWKKQTFITKNNSNGIIDSCAGCGRPQTSHTTTEAHQSEKSCTDYWSLSLTESIHNLNSQESLQN